MNLKIGDKFILRRDMAEELGEIGIYVGHDIYDPKFDVVYVVSSVDNDDSIWFHTDELHDWWVRSSMIQPLAQCLFEEQDHETWR